MACAFAFLEQSDVTGITDSKKLTATKRDLIFSKLCELRDKKFVNWALISFSPEAIDKHGVQRVNTHALNLAAAQLIKKMGLPQNIVLIADGNFRLADVVVDETKYPIESMIKADQKIQEVGAASIIAKVIRDKYMVSLHKLYPQYDWISNKGYLTEIHRQAISKFGLSKFHRKTFCSNLI